MSRSKRKLLAIVLTFTLICTLMPNMSFSTDEGVISDEPAQTEEVTTQEDSIIDESEQSDTDSNIDADAAQEDPDADKGETGIDESEQPENSDAGEAETEKPDSDDGALTEGNGNAEPLETDKETVNMPAAVFEGRAGDISVNADAAEGVFPEETSMSVKPVSAASIKSIAEGLTSEDSEVVDIKAVDITFTDKEGNEIQPASIEGLKIVLNADSKVEGSAHELIHIVDAENAKIVEAAKVDEDGASFVAEHLSIYAIVGTQVKPNKPEIKVRRTYNFYVDTQLVASQIVVNGDSLIKPAAPEKDNLRFVGWYTDDTATMSQVFGVINDIPEKADKDEVVNLYARFAGAYSVTFHREDGTVIRIKTGNTGETINVSDVTYDVGSTRAVVGWSLTNGGNDSIGDTISIAEANVDLYPVIKEVSWVVFHSNDENGTSATPTLPIYVLPGQKIGNVNDPTRYGYTFIGWNTEKNGNGTWYNRAGSPNLSDISIEHNMDLYAQWKGAQVKYKVLYWWQNADDDEYTLHETQELSGESDKMTDIRPSNNKYNYFHLSKPVVQQKIKSDGNTAVDVYYDRNIYQVRFYEYHKKLFSGSWKIIPNLTISARHGKDVSNQWPSKRYPNQYPAMWKTTEGGNIYQPNIGTMPTKDTNFYKMDSGSHYTFSTGFYLETLDGKKDILTYIDTFSYHSNLRSTDEDLYGIKGFKAIIPTHRFAYTWKYGGKSYYGWQFYYNREKYPLTFYNGEETLKSESVYYDADISRKADGLVLNAPAGAEGYVFAGWYDNAERAGKPFDFAGKKMPDGAVNFYAKWVPPTVTVSFDSENGHPDYPAQTIAVNTSAVNPGDVSRNGYQFAGWVDESGRPFNFNSPVTQDMTLHASWLSNSEFMVVYDAAGGTITVPVDNHKYVDNAEVKVLKPTEALGEKYFHGWKIQGKSEVYTPGSTFNLKSADTVGNILTLVAVYGNPPETTSIIYDPGTGNGSKRTINGLENNADYILMSCEDLGFSKEGSCFTGWKDQDGYLYDAGEVLALNNSGGHINKVTAQWAAKKHITVKAGSETFTYDGKSHAAAAVIVSNTLTEDGHTYTVSGYKAEVADGAAGSIKAQDAGSYAVNVVKSGTVKVVDENNSDVTYKFTVDTVDGQITVNKKDVHLESASASKPYDGTPLTKNEVTGGEGFVSGEVVNIRATGSITDFGTTPNTIEYKKNPSFKAGNYNISEKPGTLEITKFTNAVEVKAKSAEKVYDGKPLSKNGFDVTGMEALPQGFKVTADVSGSITDVGTVNNVISNIKIHKGSKDVTSWFANITGTDGTLRVTPKTVTLKSESATKQYDGKPLTNSKVTGADGFVAGEVANVRAIGSRTKVGSAENTITFERKANFKESNYVINYRPGTLTVTKTDKAFVVTAPTKTKVYDGKPLTAKTAEISKPEGFEAYTVEVDIEGSALNVSDGSVANVIKSVVIKDASGEDVTSEFNEIRKNNGTLTVTKRTVTLTSESATKPYDGTELSRPVVTVTGKGFVEGEVDADSIKATGSITNVGSVANTIVFTTLGNYIAENYSVTKDEGTLEITQNLAVIRVKAADAERIYNGVPLTKPEAEVTGVPDGFTSTYVISGSATNVGDDQTNAVTEFKIFKDGVDVTNQFNGIEKVPGKLIIKPRTVHLKSEGATKPYDGTALTRPAVSITGDGFVNNEASAAATGTITFVGETVNTIEVTENTGFKAANYNIDKTEGKLIITASDNQVLITAPDKTKPYDGTPLTAADAGNATAVMPAGFTGYTVEVVTSGTVTNVAEGAVDNEIKSYKILSPNGNDVTNQFANVMKVNGKLSISKREVELTSNSVERVYDGSELTAPDVTVIKNFVDGEVTDIRATGKITEVGEVPNTIKYTPAAKFDENNYSIVKNEGKLKITANATVITVTPKSAEKVYDGQELTDSEYDIAGLPNGFTAEVSIAGSIKNVGTTDNTVVSVVIKKDNKDVSAYFPNITKNKGELKVTPKAVTLSSGSASREYNGKPLTKAGVTGGEAFVPGEVDNIRATGTITNIGTVDNTIEFDKKTGFEESNYIITKNVGKLTITASSSEIVINAPSKEKVYDGTPLTSDNAGPATVIMPAGFENYKADVTMSGSITNVSDSIDGTVDNAITNVVIRDPNGNDVTSQFDRITKNAGKLTVTKRKVELKTGSRSKPYDGMALMYDNVTGGEAFVSGEASDFHAEGSIIEAGVADNKPITYTKGANFKPENYEITESYGKLEITKSEVPVTVVADSGTWMYDGQSHSKDTAAVTGVPAGFTSSYVVSGSIKDVDESGKANVITEFHILNSDSKDVTGQFKNITKTDGTLAVTPRDVKLTSETASQVYNGKALRRPVVKVEGSKFVDGEVSNIRAIGEIIEAGTVDNIITYDKSSDFKPSNYNITETVGKLTVTANEDEIVITTHNKSKVYDGTALKSTDADEPTVSLPSGFEAYQVSVQTSGEVKDVNDGEVTNKIESWTITNPSGTDVTNQFTHITKVEGKLSITPKPVTLTSEGAKRQYDGTELSRPIVSGTDGFVNGELDEAKATGKITEVGKVKNPIEFSLKPSFSEDNYSIQKVENYLEIEANSSEITVTAKDAEKIYDGQPLVQTEYTVSGLPNGFIAEVTTEGSITDFGTEPNVVKKVVVKKDNADVTDNFSNINKLNGTLTINKRSVILKSASANKAYDGKPLTDANAWVDAAGNDFVSGEVDNIRAVGSITKVGSTPNTIKYDTNASFKADNYNIVEQPGNLVITATQEAVIVTAPTKSKMYDGTPLNASDFTAAVQMPNGYDSFKVEVTLAGSITNAGDTDSTIDNVVIKNSDGDVVTDQFSEITKLNGKLTVTKRNISLTSGSDSKAYDGTPLTNSVVTEEGDGWATGEGAKYSVTGTQTLPGTSKNEFEYTLNGGTLTENYNISKTEGDLTVTNRTPDGDDSKYKYTITGNSGEFTYDGTEHSVSGFIGEESGKIPFIASNGLKYFISGVKSEAAQIDAVENLSTAINKDNLKVEDEAGNNLTEQFNITVNPGHLTIKKREAVFTGMSASKVYTGDVIEITDITASGLLDGHKSNVKYSAKGTVPGEYIGSFTPDKNLIKIKNAADNDVTKNYIINTVEGKLTITDRGGENDPKFEISIQALGDTKQYDGKEHKISGFENETGGVVEVIFKGKKYSVKGFTSTAAATDVSEISTVISGADTAKVFDENNIDVTAQFNVTAKPGVLKITKKPVSFTGEIAERIFTGETFVLSNVTVDGLLEGHTSNVVAEASGSAPNTYEGTITPAAEVKLMNGSVDVTGNYSITTTPGRLIVKPRGGQGGDNYKKYDLTIKAKSLETEYNGEVQTVEGFEKLEFTLKLDESGNLISLNDESTPVTKEFKFRVEGLTAMASGKNKGKYDSVPQGNPVVRDEANNDVTESFNIKLENGLLNIKPRKVVLTSANHTKPYDGTPLTNGGAPLKEEGWVGTEGAEYLFTGSQTEMGTADNTFNISKAKENTDLDNYDIQKVYGKLTVTEEEGRTPGTPSNPNPSNPPNPPTDITDDETPKGDNPGENTIVDYPDTPAVDINDGDVPKAIAPVTVAEEYVPKISLGKNGHTLPQTGQNFWLIELLVMLGMATSFAGSIFIVRSRKKGKAGSETK